MTKLLWGQKSQKHYESGIDRGVLYPPSGPGVIWSGLVSVEETSDGGENTPIYFDGIKTLDLINSKNFQATITAFSSPEEFAPLMGETSVIPGFILTRQPRARFNLAYRTHYGDGVGYKIHLVYNAIASPISRGYGSLGPSNPAPTRSWRIDAVAPENTNHRPSPHYVIDSTKIDADALGEIEAILYGTERSDPYFPSFDELHNLLVFWDPLQIVPDSESGVSQLIPAGGDLYETAQPGVLKSLLNSRLVPTLEPGLYRLE